MSKKVFLIILIPALLLIGGYLAVQMYLRTGNGKNEQQKEVAESANTAEQSKKIPGRRQDAAATDNKEPEAGEKPSKTGRDTAVQASGVQQKGEDESSSPLDLRPLLKEKLEQLVSKSTNGLYDLSIGGLELDVLASTVSLQNVQLKPVAAVLQNMKASGAVPSEVFSISFNRFTIDGINLDDVINKKRMDYKLVKLVNPVITIDRYQSKKNSGGKSQAAFQQQFLQQMEKLAIGRVEVDGGEVIINDKAKGTSQKLHDVQVVLNDILLNDATRNEKDRFLFAKDARLEFHDFKTSSKNGLYTFAIKTVAVDATAHKVELKNLSYGSPLSKEAFTARHSTATEMYGLALPKLTVTGVDWWPALNNETFIAGKVETNGGKLSVYFDRSLPPQNKLGNFPNQLLMKVPLDLRIQQAILNNLDISYEERNPVSGLSGTILLNKTTLRLLHLNNAENNKTPVEVKGEGLFMNKVPLTADFRFSMDSAEQGKFSATLTGEGFDGSLINPVAEPLGMMHVEKGSVQKLETSIQGDAQQASGDVKLLYKNFKLALLEKDKDDACLNKRHFMSFLANLLVLKNANPKGNKDPRIMPAIFKRDPESGFMNLVWKTALVGILKTLGAPEKMAYQKGK